MFVENELKTLKKLDVSLFIGQSYFNNDGAQLFLIFQPYFKIITTLSNLPEMISKRESKGLSNENIKPLYTENKSLSPKLVWNVSKIKVKFN